MTRPREPKTFKRPRLYYQEAYDTLLLGGRIRIIYPDGLCEWLSWGNPEHIYAPCWAAIKPYNFYATDEYGKCKSGRAALKRMRVYDYIQGWPPADFLGEL
jgi:hypothetical protein